MKSLLRDLCSALGPYCTNCIGAKWSVFSDACTVTKIGAMTYTMYNQCPLERQSAGPVKHRDNHGWEATGHRSNEPLGLELITALPTCTLTCIQCSKGHKCLDITDARLTKFCYGLTMLDGGLCKITICIQRLMVAAAVSKTLNCCVPMTAI